MPCIKDHFFRELGTKRNRFADDSASFERNLQGVDFGDKMVGAKYYKTLVSEQPKWLEAWLAYIEYTK
jgi:hypothetical protein